MSERSPLEHALLELWTKGMSSYTITGGERIRELTITTKNGIKIVLFPDGEHLGYDLKV